MCDAYELWRYRELELERKLARCPICCHCGKRVQDETLFDINGNIYHEDCAIEEFRKYTEDYTEL